MPSFHDLGTSNDTKELREKAESLGWKTVKADHKTETLDSRDWGELKKNIQRSDADILIYKGGDYDLHKKVAEHGKIDVLMSPEKRRKDSGLDHVVVKAAAKNDVAIGFNLQRLFQNSKKRSHVIKHWRRNLRLCEKYDARKILTTGAEKIEHLRAPRDAASILSSMGFQGREAVSEHPEKIIEEVER